MDYTLLGEIASFDNLYSAFEEVAKGKRTKPEFVLYALKAEENIINLQNKLINKLWHPHKTVDFFVREPKLRFISRPLIEDRIVHHAIMRVISPLFNKYWSPASFACIVGRGNLKACERLQKLYRSAIGKYGIDNIYVLQGDFKSFFKNINMNVYRAMLERVIKDEEVVSLLMAIATDYVENSEELVIKDPSSNEFLTIKHEGLPIGYLTSQSGANLVLSAFDYFITDILGIGKYYIRQMDDFRIICHSKREAYELLRILNNFIEEKLHQPLSEKKTRVFKFKGKDKFCGYIVHPHYLDAIPATIKRHERRISKHLSMWQEGKLEEGRLLSSLSSAIDYSIRTKKKSKVIEGVIGKINMSNKAIRKYKVYFGI